MLVLFIEHLLVAFCLIFSFYLGISNVSLPGILRGYYKNHYFKCQEDEAQRKETICPSSNKKVVMVGFKPRSPYSKSGACSSLLADMMRFLHWHIMEYAKLRSVRYIWKWRGCFFLGLCVHLFPIWKKAPHHSYEVSSAPFWKAQIKTVVMKYSY